MKLTTKFSIGDMVQLEHEGRTIKRKVKTITIWVQPKIIIEYELRIDGEIWDVNEKELSLVGAKTYKGVTCRGCWSLGTACGRCEKCEDTKPSGEQWDE